jgi:long-subunit fatty acid transport protein
MRRSLFVATLFALPAFAQPMDLYGFTPRSIAMGGVQASADGDYSAAYYNPALLSRGAVGIGFNWGDPNMSITPATSTPQLSAQTPVDYAGLTLGAAIPLIGLLKDKVTLGFDIYLPVRHVFRSHIIDEGTAYFLRYDNAPERFQLSMGLDVRPVEWLSIGGGAQVLSNYGGSAEFDAVLGMNMPGGIIRRRLDSEVLGVFAPVAGLAVGPFKGFKVMAYWRGEMVTTFNQPINVDLGTFGSLDVQVNGVTSYSPHVVGLGVSYTGLGDRLTVGADLAWEHWSAIPQLVPDIHIDLPQTLIDLGFNGQVVSRQVTMGFSDTWVPRLGAEYRPLDRLAVRLGYVLRPTPVPDQSGRTNFLDSTAHLASFGGGWTFDDPLKMARALVVDAAVQMTFLTPREVVKSGPNNNPNYSFGGSQLVLSLAVKYAW